MRGAFLLLRLLQDQPRHVEVVTSALPIFCRQRSPAACAAQQGHVPAVPALTQLPSFFFLRKRPANLAEQGAHLRDYSIKVCREKGTLQHCSCLLLWQLLPLCCSRCSCMAIVALRPLAPAPQQGDATEFSRLPAQHSKGVPQMLHVCSPSLLPQQLTLSWPPSSVLEAFCLLSGWRAMAGGQQAESVQQHNAPVRPGEAETAAGAPATATLGESGLTFKLGSRARGSRRRVPPGEASQPALLP